MSLTEIVQKHPKAVEILMGYGMHCFGWMAARYENLGQAAAVHGLDPDNLVRELNEKTENA